MRYNVIMDEGQVRTKAACYARVSTLLGQDPANQVIPVQEFAKARGFELVETYVDLGISGVKERRPGLDKLVKDARLGRFKIIIVSGLDRLGRDVRHLLNLIEELNHYGVSLISLREHLDFTTPVGKAALVILSAVSALERDLIRERIKTALAAKKLAAERTGSGWRCGRPTMLNKEKEAEILRLHEKGLSVRAISRRVGLGKTTVHKFLLRVSTNVDENDGEK